MKLERRIEIEKIIREALVDLLLGEGYELAVNNGEFVTEYSKNPDHIKPNLGDVDEESILTSKCGKLSHVFLVYGNSGWDVICDYGMSLEPVIEKLGPMQDQFEAEYQKETT